MPGPATAATLAAVRRAWDEGAEVRVVSYRTGAADIAVPVAGPLAGWRVEQVRRHYQGPAKAVLVVQEGVPFSDLRPAAQMATAVGLAAALRRFSRSVLVVGEDPAVLPACFRLLARGAREVVAGSEREAALLRDRYGWGTVAVEEVDAYPLLASGVELSAGGLYRPRSSRGLTIVEMPTTTLSDRARARARSSRSALERRLRGR
ncbi:MAG TPA: hypothetical protein VME46_07075 [Acidimicrobiales bacterium]|nr:hypothetical protein [Acidimicrobiales bacterium]